MKLTLINSAFMIIVHSEKNLFDGIKRAIVPIHTKHSMGKMDMYDDRDPKKSEMCRMIF